MRISGLAIALTFAGVALASGPAPVVSVANAQGSETTSQRLDRLERLIEARTQGQMSMLEQLNRLNREVSELRGITEEHTFQLDQILQRQRDIYQEIDQLGQQIRNGGGGSATRSGAAPTSVPTIDIAYSDDLSENEAYDRAVRLVLEERRYDQAIPEFQAFLQNYPNSTYRSNALYWLGQLHYASQNYDEAKRHFTDVVENHPDSSKRADCILKLGMIERARGNNSQARTFFQRVRSEYPNSTEAGLAARQLESL
ncbi:tol-pal system protein YbgF [Aliidiomarina halalkaliphila]|uniref:Cell division coordinator CpoB n=1 Tax=Aliidiomarina halalkaliphila TaxID=2593535 RepID=A0A552X6R7_9GAMM|nr:tol-pal system protein YbgF [Aliidiomarina halalkaliphila]TRW50253.1 tol-pal system protein YbgF [Aliidiomarina halalkaliphila]